MKLKLLSKTSISCSTLVPSPQAFCRINGFVTGFGGNLAGFELTASCLNIGLEINLELHVVLAAVRACAARDSAICSNSSEIHTRGFILSIKLISGFLYGLRPQLSCLLLVDCKGKVFWKCPLIFLVARTST